MATFSIGFLACKVSRTDAQDIREAPAGALVRALVLAATDEGIVGAGSG